MVEHRCSTKQEPEESQNSNIYRPVSEIITTELQYKGLFTRTINVTVFVSGIHDLFDISCKQHHWTALNPFLNSTEKWRH